GNVDSWSISPNLPDGLSFDTATGIISGTPSEVSSTETYTVTATNTGGTVAFNTELTVNDAAPSALSYTNPNVFTVGETIADLTPSITGNVDSWSEIGRAPGRDRVDIAAGVISGKPTEVSSTATYTVTATQTGGRAAI